jgi:hypothetical protein
VCGVHPFVKRVCVDALISIHVLHRSPVLVWFMLGAMLNPNAYLPYAAAAATFFTFVTTKLHDIKTLQGELRSVIKAYVMKKMKEVISASPIAGFGMDPDQIVNAAVDGNLKEAVIGVASQKIRGVLASTPLGEQASKMGLDPEILARLASGDFTAMEELGAKWGIDPAIMKLFVGLARKDEAATVEALKEICSKDGISFDPNLVVAVFKLVISKHSSSEGKLFIKQALNNILSSPELSKQIMTHMRGVLPAEISAMIPGDIDPATLMNAAQSQAISHIPGGLPGDHANNAQQLLESKNLNGELDGALTAAQGLADGGLLGGLPSNVTSSTSSVSSSHNAQSTQNSASGPSALESQTTALRSEVEGQATKLAGQAGAAAEQAAEQAEAMMRATAGKITAQISKVFDSIIQLAEGDLGPLADMLALMRKDTVSADIGECVCVSVHVCLCMRV